MRLSRLHQPRCTLLGRADTHISGSKQTGQGGHQGFVSCYETPLVQCCLPFYQVAVGGQANKDKDTTNTFFPL